ncbi:DsbA family protein [Ammoniphilus resinae]|uniref:Protein-disulfide isomerase n=1 Tax=Ammoniphilus resinae TaxID=861532 RepID=A0ABS4GVE3_9BACL|nr:thioredoxin domain-containing protein [Ammoniphilus resinae]MBP1934248.1 protein-disulfide isomerase [Ammoniphilus resinae]
MGKKNDKTQTKKQKRQIKEAQAKKSQRLMGWTFLVVLIVFIGFIVAGALSGPKEARVVNATEFQYAEQPSLGSDDAPIKLVEFADFKCPACKYFGENIMPQLQKDFIDTGKVQLFFTNYLVISPDADSKTAAMAGEAIYQQKPEEFWKFYEAVFAAQGDEKTNWATSDRLVQIAKDANVAVDLDKLKKAIDEQTFASKVDTDETIAGKSGVRSTPTLFMNGKEVSNDATFDYNLLKEEILKELEEAGK